MDELRHTHESGAHAHQVQGSGIAQNGHFLRHLLEMAFVMTVGMVAGAAVFTVGAGFVASRSLTFDEARLRYPEVCLLVIAVIMSVPMVAWMRRAGHGWRSASEMSAAMVVPALALIGLFWLHVLTREPLCAVYCVVMFPAMVVAMLARRSEYAHGGASMVGSHPRPQG